MKRSDDQGAVVWITPTPCIMVKIQYVQPFACRPTSSGFPSDQNIFSHMFSVSLTWLLLNCRPDTAHESRMKVGVTQKDVNARGR